jgi:serine/threonine protein kinase/Flp pilus assembly protein TadD
MKCPKCQFENPSETRFCGNCGTKLPPSEEKFFSSTETLQTPIKELTTGSIFAQRYEVIEELGKGGMGKVYKVFDKKIKEKVALKLLKPEIAADEETIERFSNELRYARKIAHRNVCRMYDLGEEKGTHYITMEYVPGEDLKSSIIRMGPLSAGKAISIAKQVCEGLAEAHRQGVVHRDLKPQNIMIDKEGNAKIMDFGIARSLKAKRLTGTGVMIGTPEYMSPEQVDGKEADQRADIYALGVIIYEMLTGHVPFVGETPFSVAYKQKNEIPQDPKKFNPQIPYDLSQLVLHCMEKEREKRYQSADEIFSELAKIERGIPTTERIMPERKPFTSKQITVTFGVKKLFIPALVFIALVIVGVILWRVLSHGERAPIPTGKPSLAIMYFKNNTGDEKLDHWRTAISDLLITDLAQSKYVSVLSGDKLFNILSEMNQLEAKNYTSKVLREVGARGGVKNIMVGSYAKAGDNFRIDVTLQEADTGELLKTERAEGKGEEGFFSMVDELTRRIKADLKIPAQEIAGDIDQEIGKITTSSPEAYKYYSEGTKLHYEHDERQSIQTMEKAIALDPEFAMAYRSMSMSLGNLGYYSEARKYLQKALGFTDRVSDRERFTIQADYYRDAEENYDKAIEAYTQLLQLYPDDSIGNTNLGIIYTNIEEWDKAIEHYEARIQKRDETYFPYTNIVDSCMAKGLYDKAKEVLESYIRNFKENYMIRLYLCVVYYIQGKCDLALVEANKASALNPSMFYNFMAKGDIYRDCGDWPKAETEYLKLLELEEKAANLYGRDNLAAFYLLQGKYKESEEQLKKGIELAQKIGDKGWESDFYTRLACQHLESGNPAKALGECDKALDGAMEMKSQARQRSILFARGIAYAELKSMAEAQKTADELRSAIEKSPNQKAIRYYYQLAGRIELEKGNYSLAIEHIKKSIALLPFQYWFANEHALFMDSLALAYFKAGDLEKAREEYEKIANLTVGRFYYGDIYAKSFYRLGKTYEQQGQKEKAKENYQKFLDLWKDADPGLMEVKDAGRRLASLKSASF